MGQATGWYSQHNLRDFATFVDLRDKFARLFHRRVSWRELIGQFYAIYQEAYETVLSSLYDSRIYRDN